MPLPSDALAEFGRLLDDATTSGDPEPTAMHLSTVGADGRVHARMVLLKGHGPDGFRFFTNRHSDKGAQLAEHAQVALVWHWKTVREGIQVRVEGAVTLLDDAASDAYFASRPRVSQIGAWASLQSQTLPSREEFEERIARYEKEFDGRAVPRPPHWGGYLVTPDMIEFWYAAKFRLHERVRYEWFDGEWTKRELYP